MITNANRRRFLSFLGIAGATATASAAAIVQPKPVEESRAPFKHPAEYLATMQSIGWKAVASYALQADGSVRPMGVNEFAPDRRMHHETWTKFHAIQMRTPVQWASDMPQDDWWKRVWRYLYDKGLREDVTPA